MNKAKLLFITFFFLITIVFSFPIPSFADVGNPGRDGFSVGIFGSIKNPTSYTSTNGEGLFLFLSNIFKLAGVVAGIILIVRLIGAGYIYLSAIGDPKKFQQASDTITQSILGLVIVAGAFILAGLVGRLTGIDVLNPVIYGP